jgi:hypothetical protein
VSFNYSRYVVGGGETLTQPRESLTLNRPNGDQITVNGLVEDRPLQAQLAERGFLTGGTFEQQ